MELPQILLDVLACPACQGEIAPVQGGGGVICARCRRVYPVVDGILNMLVSEAKVEGEGGSSSK